MLFFDAAKSIEITLFESNYLTVLCLWLMCLDLSLYIKVCAPDIVVWLSQ